MKEVVSSNSAAQILSARPQQLNKDSKSQMRPELHDFAPKLCLTR